MAETPTRNPEGHSPRYWRRHPNHKPALPDTSIMHSPKPKPLLQRIVRWGALAVGILLWGSGVAAMYGDDYKTAVGLYLVGIIIIAADFITLEDHGEYKGLRKAVMLGSTAFVALLAMGLSIAWIQLRKRDVKLPQVQTAQSETKTSILPSAAPTTTSPSVPTQPELKRQPKKNNGNKNQPTFRDNPDIVSVSAGTNVTTLVKQRSLCVFMVTIDNRKYCLVMARVEKGKLLIDANLFAGPGLSPVAVTGGVLVQMTPEWDRNFDNTALEVVNEKLVPVLQIIYTSPQNAVVRGLFQLEQRRDIVIVLTDTTMTTLKADTPLTKDNYAVTRLFRYPSRKYLGQEEPTQP
jgi:hypothetical protein